ncbi:MAG: YaeQ family protein [Desulfobacter sp.]|nr:MAG: YaeQ family protein [Desulfobacter sp.]
MALKPTIYKFKVTLADIDRGHYNDLSLTVARHPSENTERMMARVLAFCMNDCEGLAFTKGLSTTEEPDIWQRSLDGRVALWIDIGEPAAERIKKASRQAEKVRVYPFNFKSEEWYKREQAKLSLLPVSVIQFQWKGVQSMAAMAERTMEISVTVSDGRIYVSGEKDECEIPWTIHQ